MIIKKLISSISAILFACLASAMAAGPVITGYDNSGRLTFSSTGNNAAFTLEFAGTPCGPWTNWGSVTEQPITGAVMSIQTPMFYRIKETDVGVVSNAALRAYLISRGFDHNGDGRIDAEEAATLKTLRCSESTAFQVLDLTPFVNLMTCDFWDNNNQFTSIDVAHNAQLELIFIPAGSIQDLHLPQAPKLEYVSVNGNALTNIDLSSAYGLKSFSAQSNSLSVLDIYANTNLTSVDVRGNPIAEIIVWWDTNSASPITLQYNGSPVIRNP